MDRVISEEIIKRFCFKEFCFEDVRIVVPDRGRTVKRDFPLILFHPKKVIFFVKLKSDANRDSAMMDMRAGLNCLCNKLYLSMNDFVVCGVSRKSFFVLNKYNDRVSVFGDDDMGREELLAYIENELSYGPDIFSPERMRVIQDQLIISTGFRDKNSNLERKRILEDGTVYIRKHGTWKESSWIHPETLYLLTVFGGIFGTHLFFQKKWAKGILYLFTFGLFGFGWFFDSIEILLGIYRDPDGRYVAPMESKLLSILILFFGFLVCYLFASFAKILVSGLLFC